MTITANGVITAIMTITAIMVITANLFITIVITTNTDGAAITVLSSLKGDTCLTI